MPKVDPLHRCMHSEYYKYLILFINFSFFALLMCGLLLSAPAQAQIARVLETKGTALVERSGQVPRLLGAGERLDERDVINVARDSWAILEFNDQTRITLRPNTVFRVDSYRANAPETMLMGLLKGGMRVVTGLFGKRNPSGVKYQTAVATIGIRGTEFDARLCEEDCSLEERLHPAPLRALAAARVVEMKGQALAARVREPARMLVTGAALYEGDGIITGSGGYVVLVFRDGSRITVSAGSLLKIHVFQFDESRRTGRAVLNHHGGGVMVHSGAIAKQGPEFYRFISPMGEIRPRGTGFLSQVQSGAESVGDTAQAARDETERRAAEEAAKVAEEAARSAAAVKAEADRVAAAAAAEAARLAAEAERLAAEAAAAARQIAQDATVVLGGAKPGAGLRPQSPSNQIDLAALSAAEAARAAAVAEEAARAAAVAAAAEAERLAATAAAAAERANALAAAVAERVAAEAKLKVEQDAAAAKLKLEQDAANAANHDFTQYAKTPASPVSTPLPFLNLPPKSVVTSGLERKTEEAERSAAEIRRQAETLGAGAAVAALQAATDPILNQMTALLTQLRNNPPQSEAAAQQIDTQMRLLSDQINAALGSSLAVVGDIAKSTEYKAASAMIDLAVLYSWNGMANGISYNQYLGGEFSPLAVNYRTAYFSTLLQIYDDPYRRSSFAVIGMSDEDFEQALPLDICGVLCAAADGRADGSRINPSGSRISPDLVLTNGPMTNSMLVVLGEVRGWVETNASAAMTAMFTEASPNPPTELVIPNLLAVWDGEVEIVGGGTVKSGEKFVLGDIQSARAEPRDFLSASPRPDLVKVDPGLFGGEPKPIDAGLYVWVRDGEVSLTKADKTVDVPKDNAAVATREDVKLLDTVPNFMRFDPTPVPNQGFDSRVDAFKLPDGAMLNMCTVR